MIVYDCNKSDASEACRFKNIDADVILLVLIDGISPLVIDCDKAVISDPKSISILLLYVLASRAGYFKHD